MRVVGVTGGIGAGKTTVTGLLAEHGAAVIDADQLAREAVEPGTPGLEAIQKRFSGSVIGPDGRLDRAALGAIVFSDPRALADLNGITHPEVGRLAKQRIAHIASVDAGAIVVYDVPLLVESANKHDFDLIVTVEAPIETRVQRLVELRGMDEAEARRRIANQASQAQRTAVAHVVIDSGGSLAQVREQTDALWQSLVDGTALPTPAAG